MGWGAVTLDAGENRRACSDSMDTQGDVAFRCSLVHQCSFQAGYAEKASFCAIGL